MKFELLAYESFRYFLKLSLLKCNKNLSTLLEHIALFCYFLLRSIRLNEKYLTKLMSQMCSPYTNKLFRRKFSQKLEVFADIRRLAYERHIEKIYAR